MKQDDNKNTKAAPVPSDENQEATQKSDAEIQEWKNKYLRALADYQNLEKRMFAEREEIRKMAAEVVLKKFLNGIDSLERASKHLNNEGLSLTLKEFYAALESSGVKRMAVTGKKFDPFYMECLEVVDGDQEVVVEEVTAGYLLYDKILRVAQVKVGGGKK